MCFSCVWLSFCIVTEGNLIIRLQNDNKEFLIFMLCRTVCRQSRESLFGAHDAHDEPVHRMCDVGSPVMTTGPCVCSREALQKMLRCALCVESFTSSIPSFQPLHIRGCGCQRLAGFTLRVYKTRRRKSAVSNKRVTSGAFEQQ